MGQIGSKADSVYRDFAQAGVKASGLNEPKKDEIRELFGVVDIAVYASQAGLATVADLAARDAFFADAANQGKLVYVNNNNGADDDPANGVYEYVGGAARIATGFYQGVATVVQPLVDEATAAAEAAQLRSRIAAAEGRAVQYGVSDPVKVQAFGAEGVELDFGAGYYRLGHEIATAPTTLPGFSFNRDSVATFDIAAGVVRTWAEDVARIVPNLGLVVEPGTQNILLRSQEFDHAAWDKINAGAGLAPVVVANDAVAPDGSLTADKITLSLDGSDTPGDRSHLQQDLAPAPGSSYAASLYVKGVDGEKILLRHVAGAGYLIHEFDGAWQRIEKVEVADGGVGTIEFGLRGGMGASGAVSFHSWGGQVEPGGLVTSYIPTGEFSGARDEDTALLDGFIARTCTILIEAMLTTGSSATLAGLRSFATLYAGTGADDRVTVINNDEGGIGAVIEPDGGLSGVSTAAAVAPSGVLQRIAVRIAADDVQIVRDGVPGNWVFDAAIPVSLNKLSIGGTPLSELARLGGVIRKVVLFPFALTTREMTALTGGAADPAGTVTWERLEKNVAFSTRDSAKTFKLGGYQYVANGYVPMVEGASDLNARHDVWRSPNGRAWEQVHPNPAYEKFSTVMALDGVIYAWRTKMWKSVDGGFNWVKILDVLPWGESGFENPAIVHRGELLYFHCIGGVPAPNEGVWRFDPVAGTWTQKYAAAWGGRLSPALAEFKGDLIVIGGFRNEANVPPESNYPDKTTLNDVWKSTDGGTTFTLLVEDLPCAPRAWPCLIALEERLWMMGGFDNISINFRNYDDTWVSDDGENWERVFATRNYLQRHAGTPFVLNGELMIIAGNANAAATGQVLNDLWRLMK
jgi:hypothetical protein